MCSGYHLFLSLFLIIEFVTFWYEHFKDLVGNRMIHLCVMQVCGLKWSPDSQYLASGGNDNKLFVWNLHSLTPVQTYTEHNAAVKGNSFSLLLVCKTQKCRTIDKLWNVCLWNNSCAKLPSPIRIEVYDLMIVFISFSFFLYIDIYENLLYPLTMCGIELWFGSEPKKQLECCVVYFFHINWFWNV